MAKQWWSFTVAAGLQSKQATESRAVSDELNKAGGGFEPLGSLDGRHEGEDTGLSIWLQVEVQGWQ